MRFLLPLLFINLFAFAADINQQIDPNAALTRLLEGNKRFVNNQSTPRNRYRQRRAQTAEAQYPFAVILACADSRVAPEIIFDQGIGDLFVVRNAGNVASPISIESIDYAADALGSSLIIVLGHESCGAVSAVLQGKIQDMPTIGQMIEPAVKESLTQAGDRLENAIADNVKYMVEQLKKDPILKKLMNENRVKIVGGCYHFKTGEVEILN